MKNKTTVVLLQSNYSVGCLITFMKILIPPLARTTLPSFCLRDFYFKIKSTKPFANPKNICTFVKDK